MIRLLLATVAVASLSACTTTERGLWTHKSGGIAHTVNKPNDSAVVQTRFGGVVILPSSISDEMGLGIQYHFKNASKNSASFRIDDLKLQLSDGQIVEPMSELQLRDRIAGKLGRSSTTAKVWANIQPNILRSGEVLSDSAKTGLVFYPVTDTKGPFKIRINNIVKDEVSVEFSSLKKQ